MEPSNQTLKSMIDDLKEKSNERHAEYREIQHRMDEKLDIILAQTTLLSPVRILMKVTLLEHSPSLLYSLLEER